MPTKDEINRRKRVEITNPGSRGFSPASFRPRDKGMCIFIQLGDNGTQTRVLPRARHRVIFDPRRYLSTFAPRASFLLVVLASFSSSCLPSPLREFLEKSRRCVHPSITLSFVNIWGRRKCVRGL